jgi:SecD/SecF fusion protein
MRPFFWRIVICVVPVLVSALIVARATQQYLRGEGGFRPGVDLVGGTILVYEIDPDRITAAGDANAKSNRPARATAAGPAPAIDIAELAEKLKRRIDPGDQKNVTVRAVGSNRVEIILPTGGAHQSRIEQERWDNLLAKVKQDYPALADVEFDAGRGQVVALATQAARELRKDAWKAAVAKVEEKFPKAKDAKLGGVPVGDTAALAKKTAEAAGVKEDEVKALLDEVYKPRPESEIADAVKKEYNPDGRRRDVTAEEVEDIKAKIRQAGFLVFQILANNVDDAAAVAQVRDYFKDPANKNTIEATGRADRPPPPPEGDFTIGSGESQRTATYRWVELGKSERKSLGLNERAAEEAEKELAELTTDTSISEKKKAEIKSKLESQKARRDALAEARAKGEVYIDPGYGQAVFFSRPVAARHQSDEDQGKKIEYFLLTRSNPEDTVKVDGRTITIFAEASNDEQSNLAVSFTLNAAGGQEFGAMTLKNRPSETGFQRFLAIVLDDQIMSAPALRAVIRDRGQITGNFTKREVDNLIGIFRSGALPATLRPLPVSENTIGPTLGEDTIVSGTRAVGLAFALVLVFMLIYYRFAGLVACVALLANLLLTVAFMVFFGAAFTLPGLAGLVLMLGMAVDANILIYERLREERDRGANLAMAIRNGYDRAMPTIIDTHLSSIFTAIVLYAVGNDQLKGFGVSLTSGLIISLFTSLYMTRLMFDLWLKYAHPQQFGMLRLLTKTRIDFMAIRYYWFTATVILTVLGISVFAIRGQASLNVDFVGGTVYGGQLKEARAISSSNPPGLRQLLAPEHQHLMLKVAKVEQTDALGREYHVTYDDGMTQTVALPEAPGGDAQKAYDRKFQAWKNLADDAARDAAKPELDSLLAAAKQENEAAIAKRAGELPDVSVEQIFLTSDKDAGAGKSRFFTVRTSEKAPELVQLAIFRLLREGEGENAKSLLAQTVMKVSKQPDGYLLEFTDNSEERKPVTASPGFLRQLLDREFAKIVPPDAQTGDLFDLRGEGKNIEGRFQRMKLESKLPDDKLKQAIEKVAQTFSQRPQPERLETFDPQLAKDTRGKALYAIGASWLAILVYLWFRFGNWTFGAAAVLCLVHDLCFTLGIIAFCHYFVGWAPGLASVLLLEDFKIDLTTVAALLTLVGYSVNDTIVVFDRIREVRGKNPLLTPQMINDSINQTLSRTILASTTVFLVVMALFIFGGEGVHLFAFVMVVGVIVGTYSSIYIASPLLLIFGEGTPAQAARDRRGLPERANA